MGGDVGVEGAVQLKSGTGENFQVMSCWPRTWSNIRPWVSGRKGCITLTQEGQAAQLCHWADPMFSLSPWDLLEVAWLAGVF